MRELAKSSGVTTSLISQIVNDKANPSINTLIAISNALNTDIREFFQGYGVVGGSPSVVHLKDRALVGNRDGGILMQYLTASYLKKFAVIYNCFQKGTSTNMIPEIDNPTQAGYEFSYVLKGRLEFNIEGSVYILDEGDAITFEARKKHAITNIFDGISEAIWVIIPGKIE